MTEGVGSLWQKSRIQTPISIIFHRRPIHNRKIKTLSPLWSFKCPKVNSFLLCLLHPSQSLTYYYIISNNMGWFWADSSVSIVNARSAPHAIPRNASSVSPPVRLYWSRYISKLTISTASMSNAPRRCFRHLSKASNSSSRILLPVHTRRPPLYRIHRLDIQIL